jgi:hypothetical protein
MSFENLDKKLGPLLKRWISAGTGAAQPRLAVVHQDLPRIGGRFSLSVRT